MRMIFCSVFIGLTLLGSAIVSAQPASGPDLGIPEELKPTGQYVTLKPKTDAKSIMYIGRSGVDALPSEFLADPRWFLLDTRGMATGRYLFTAVGTKDDALTRIDFTVIVGDAPAPEPIPEPGPGPQPPGPGPAPNPNDQGAVIGAEGLRVMIVEETNDRDKLPTSQLYAMTGKELVEYLNLKCGKDGTGKPDWHLYDDDYTPDQQLVMPAHWQVAYKKAVEYAHGLQPETGPKGAYQAPVIIVSNSLATTLKPRGVLRKLPQVNPEIMTLVKKYGEAK